MNTPDSQETPAQVRARIRLGQITGHTSALCPGYAQANLVILPQDWAFDFLLFCVRNPRSCPLLEVMELGMPFTGVIAKSADVRTELPRYRVWENGKLTAEPTDITDLWRADLVSFFIGCSFSFDQALLDAGLPVRHLEMGRNVPMYQTQLQNARSGRLQGPLVVSMRPMPADKVAQAEAVSGQFGGAHGAPVHSGDPAHLGIADLDHPQFGQAVEIKDGEVPVFWACGVTPQAAIMDARPPFCITHSPGHMFITDLTSEELEGVGEIKCV